MSPSPEAPPREPKLLDRVRDALRARHMSYRTEKAYVHWIRRSFPPLGLTVQPDLHTLFINAGLSDG